MKLNKSKNNKGKIHPSPSSSSSSSPTTIDSLSNLSTILPATIMALISVLTLSDKEVLTYMISHSLDSFSSSAVVKTTKKVTGSSKGTKFTAVAAHTVPTFDCACFDCYTYYWYRWDSSPNRDIIHQVLEAFEDHLAAVEAQPPPPPPPPANKSTRRREKVKKNGACSSSISSENAPAVAVDAAVVEEEASPEEVECAAENGGGGGEEAVVVAVEQKRKVLPDVIGLFNSRLWNLWGPNV